VPDAFLLDVAACGCACETVGRRTTRIGTVPVDAYDPEVPEVPDAPVSDPPVAPGPPGPAGWPAPPVEPLDVSGTHVSDALWTGTLDGTEIADGACPAGSCWTNVSFWPLVVTTVTVQVSPSADATGTASTPMQTSTAHAITRAAAYRGVRVLTSLSVSLGEPISSAPVAPASGRY
jgi:hypothetical protein